MQENPWNDSVCKYKLQILLAFIVYYKWDSVWRNEEVVLLLDHKQTLRYCGRRLELDDPWGPLQPKPFYDSTQNSHFTQKEAA